ncbi:MAG: hypothetical protein IJC17_00165 [Clostridia bacterium]|nr:hypothetical protein [Clostridia bacterium]
MALKQAKAVYPQIRYAVVLAYLPTETPEYEETVYPLEGVPARFAIDRRNRWMIEQSDIVVTYVNRGFGGAAKFKEIAKKKEKTIIELNDIRP